MRAGSIVRAWRAILDGRWPHKRDVRHPMDFDPELLAKAYVLHTEWGPKARIPRRQRLRLKLWILSSRKIDALIGLFDNVNASVWRLAEQGGDAKLGREGVESALTQQYPFLSGDALNRARFLVNYYAWHEGYAS